MRRVRAVLFVDLTKDRDERLRQRALCEQIAQEVGHAEADLERVGGVARADEQREHLLPHEAEQARDQRCDRDEPGRPGETRHGGIVAHGDVSMTTT